MKKLTIIMLILDILAGICFFAVYGPFDKLRNTVINTAMATKTHQYIAYTFYSEETVSKVMSMGSYIPLTDNVNLDDIVIDSTPKKVYTNQYDEAILTRDEGNELYKYLEIEVGGYKAHLAAIYDPTKVHLITSRSFNTGYGQETVLSMCERLNGKVCINGGMFADPTGWGSDIPMGYLIKDGKIIWSDSSDARDLIGFTKEGKLLLVHATGDEAIAMGVVDALEFGPFLMVNGKKMEYVNAIAGGYQRAARVAIAQRKDGVVLFLVTRGVHMNGPSLIEVMDTLEKYGAYNAANLDGGTSSQMVVNGNLVNDPVNIFNEPVIGGRSVVSGFGLIE